MATQLWMATPHAVSANVTKQGPTQPFVILLTGSANAKAMWLAKGALSAVLASSTSPAVTVPASAMATDATQRLGSVLILINCPVISGLIYQDISTIF